jgi:hypothetical protein
VAVITEDVARSFGNWKREKKKRAEQYAGVDGVYMDRIWIKVVSWDIAELFSRLPMAWRRELEGSLTWVRGELRRNLGHQEGKERPKTVLHPRSPRQQRRKSSRHGGRRPSRRGR